MNFTNVRLSAQFEVGCSYLRQDGKRVTIINAFEDTVQGDDGEDFVDENAHMSGWRYDRPNDAGRVTGSAHDFSDPRNLVVGSKLR